MMAKEAFWTTRTARLTMESTMVNQLLWVHFARMEAERDISTTLTLVPFLPLLLHYRCLKIVSSMKSAPDVPSQPTWPLHVYQAKTWIGRDGILIRWLNTSYVAIRKNFLVVQETQLLLTAKWRLVLKRELDGCRITIEFFQVIESSLLRKKYVDHYITWHMSVIITWINKSKQVFIPN